MIYQEFEKGFRNYAIQKLGEKRGNKLKSYIVSTLEKGVNAASTLTPQYDLGIGIASDGLWFSYLFGLYGLPTIVVDMKRRLNGATWKEIDKVGEEQIKNKKVILFDNDVVSGRTIRRAVREIIKFKPKKIDLLLSVYNTYMSMTYYKKHKRFLKEKHKIIGEERYGKYVYLIVDTSYQIPKEIGRIFALDKDFKEVYNTKNLEEKLLEVGSKKAYQNQDVLLGKP